MDPYWYNVFQHSHANGQIPVQEFEDIVEKYRTSLPEATIRRLLEYTDKNKDGYISKEEIMRLVGQDVRPWTSCSIVLVWKQLIFYYDFIVGIVTVVLVCVSGLHEHGIDLIFISCPIMKRNFGISVCFLVRPT